MAEWDEEPEQVNYLSNNNHNFYNNAPFNNSNNRAFQSDPPEPYIDPAVSDFMHEQGKMNQMMFEQMQAISAQLAAQSKAIKMRMSHQADSSQPPHYQGPVMPIDSTAKNTDCVESTRTVHTPPVAETEHPDRAKPTRLAEINETTENIDHAESTQTVQKGADNLGELTHGPHASCMDRAPQLEELEMARGAHRAHMGTSHGPDISHTDRATAQTEQLTPELKPLPSNLRYEFLDPDKSCPVIISADLKPDRTATLLEKLKAHKCAIGCSIKDSKEILWILLMQEFDRVVRVPQKWVLPPVPPDPPPTNQ